MNWEYFCDASYYDLWAVRPVGEKRWGCCYHMNSGEEARGLAALLTNNKVPSPFQNLYETQPLPILNDT